MSPWNTWWATCRPEESWALSGSMESGSPGSGKVKVPPGLGVPCPWGAAAVRRPGGAGGERRRPADEEGGHRQEDDEPGRAQRHQLVKAGAPPPAVWPVRVRARRRPARVVRPGAESAARGRRQPSLQMRTNVFRKNSTPTMMV